MPQRGDRHGLLDGKYRLIDELGSGGFGHVRLAEDDLLDGRKVAIKVLHERNVSDQTLLIAEMRALAALKHPGIVGFYHHFKVGDNLHLVMEYCSAGNLRDRMQAAPVTQDQAFQ